MITINSDTAAVETHLRKIEQLIVANGAYLSPDVSVLAQQGNLSLLSALSPQVNNKLLSVPESCLPAVSDFDLKIENDEFVIQSYAKGVSQTHVQLQELMLELYNQTEKLKTYQRSSPWLIPTPILTQLFKARAKADKIKKFYNYAQTGNWQTLLIESFLGSRTFNLKTKQGENRMVLMPFIDFANHHHFAKGYQTKQNQLNLFNSKKAGSEECFVFYTALDSLDTYLIYHFIEPDVPFVRSIPLEIQLPIGTLEIYSRISSAYPQPLPPNLQDLRSIMPTWAKQKQRLSAAHLIIPGETMPRALRRVLGVLIQQLEPYLTKKQLFDYILFAEEQILAQNMTYYRDTASMLVQEKATLPETTFTELQTLLALQMRKLSEYKQRANLA